MDSPSFLLHLHHPAGRTPGVLTAARRLQHPRGRGRGRGRCPGRCLHDPLGVRRCFGDVLHGLRCERAPAGVLPRERWSGPCYGEDWARRPLPRRLIRRRRFQRLRRALRDSGDERRQLRAPEPAPLLEQGGLVRPPPTLIWMGLAPVLDSPLLMMASSAGVRVVSVPLGSVPCEESKTHPVGACKVPVILFC